jgi:hypothetical protein
MVKALGITLGLVAGLLSGCSSMVMLREVASSDPVASWRRVLQRFVDEQGRIDFVGLSHDMSDLETYVSYLSQTGPGSSPALYVDAHARLAFDINAYNAVAMYNVVHFNIPKDHNSFFKRLRFFNLTHYSIAGREMSLEAFEKDMIRPMGDPRSHLALNTMARSSPRLPREPFTGQGLEGQLENQGREFFNDEKNVVVDPDRQIVRLSELMKFYRDEFLTKSPSLIAFVNTYRKVKIPENYKVEFLDFDWTINGQSAPAVTVK